MFDDIQMVDNSSHVEVGILVREFNSRVSHVTAFWVVVISSTR